MKQQFTRGTIEIVILSLLKEGDSYGYELCNNIFIKSKGLYHIQEGTMYPSLYRMIERGYVEVYEKLVGKKRTRQYYKITDSGIDHYNELCENFVDSVNGVCAIMNHNDENEVVGLLNGKETKYIM